MVQPGYDQLASLFGSAHEKALSEGTIVEPPSMKDFFGLTKSMNSNLINILNEHKMTGKRFIDLGSGIGWPMILANLGAGMVSYGIEARLVEFELSKRVIQILGQSTTLDSHPFYGNFFPPDFKVGYMDKWRFVWDIPGELRRSRPYEDMGLNLSDFSVIHFYQYNRNLPAVMDYISQRASPGTLIINPTNQVKGLEFPKNFKKIESSYDAAIFYLD
ncbi:MAG: hypothetical protein NDI94_06650 [Candidatus Woesearchaeota archaeon]|nr:hypothetical protein [Candidatus Woesearchaeota archaeon]